MTLYETNVFVYRSTKNDVYCYDDSPFFVKQWPRKKGKTHCGRIHRNADCDLLKRKVKEKLVGFIVMAAPKRHCKQHIRNRWNNKKTNGLTHKNDTLVSLFIEVEFVLCRIFLLKWCSFWLRATSFRFVSIFTLYFHIRSFHCVSFCSIHFWHNHSERDVEYCV